MKRKILSVILAIAMLTGLLFPFSAAAQSPDEAAVSLSPGRERLNFNQGWKFIRDYIPEAAEVDYNMEELKQWENVNLPHSVRLEPYMNSGKTYQGHAMYRKHFTLDETYKGKKLFITFEGIMGVTDVWVNGVHMQTKLAEKTGENTYYGGYLPIVLDVTELVHCDGSENVITVHADNSDNQDVPPGKPQSGLDFTYFGGIYRDAWLDAVSPVHITDANYEDIVAGGGISVDYPSVSSEQAEVSVQTHLRNETGSALPAILRTQVVDASGAVVASAEDSFQIAADGDFTQQQLMTVQDPKLWNLETPYLHTLVSTVTVDGVEVDRVETKIGIRKIEMHKSFGLKINGEVQDSLVGVNRHQEYAYIGYAASSSLQRSDAVKFRTAGMNVVRTAHYPMSREFLDACDELGILIIEPTPGWQHYRNNDTFKNRVYNDIRAMVRRDRNHPCMLAYEMVLNETSGAPGSFTQGLAQIAKEEHPSAKTASENSLVNNKDEINDILYNNADKSSKAVSFTREYGDSYREQYGPNNFHNRRVTRGVGSFYPGGEGAMFQQAIKRLVGNQAGTPFYEPIDANSTGTGGAGGSSRAFLANVEKRAADPGYIGSTMWIGIDHNRGYEDNMASCGLWDLYRIPKFSYYAMESQRSAEKNDFLEARGVKTGPMLFIASNWTEKAPVIDKSVEVNKKIGTDAERVIIVYSNAETVKLSVVKDGETLWSETASPATRNNADLLAHAPFEFYTVPYTQGSSLYAEGYDANGNVIAQQTVHTAGEPVKLQLTADSEGMDLIADGSDAVMLLASVLDADGNVCPEASNELTFTVTDGGGSIIGSGDLRVGSNPVHAEAGVIGAYLQAPMTPGDVTITVESPGLEPATLTIPAVEMQEKAAPYIEIPYEGGSSTNSGYLHDFTESTNWSVRKFSGDFGDTYYRKSIKVSNNTEMTYDLNGIFNRFTSTVGVGNESYLGDKAVTFRIYADGTLKYCSPVLKKGETAKIDIDVSGAKQLRLQVSDENMDLVPNDNNDNGYAQYWLSPYLYEGSTPDDESELRQNLALNKPAEATSSVDGTDPSMALDGSLSTIWRGELVETGELANPQEFVVDLGERQDIKNARVAPEHDSIFYTYEIYTSEDKENWTKRVTNTKTSQASDELDYFTATDVRYVKVRFTDVPSNPDRGQPGNAALAEFEVYPDHGIDAVREYNLKGISIAAKDLVFDSAKTDYTLMLEGFEQYLDVRALAYDPQARISINGQAVSNPAEATSVSAAQKIRLDDLGPDNRITIDVVSANGRAKKTYTIQVKGELGKIFASNANNAFTGVNGDNGWHYQELKNGVYADMTSGYLFVKNGDTCWTGSETYSRSGPRYMHPGNNADTVRAYRAPKDGTLQVSGIAKMYVQQNGPVKVIVRKNGEKIWPANADAFTLNASNRADISAVCEVEEGDMIQYVINAAGSNGGDATCLDTTVRYLDDITIEQIDILGDGELSTGWTGPFTKAYAAQGILSSGERVDLSGDAVIWSIDPPVEGVSVNAEGVVAIEESVKSADFALCAQLSEDEAVTARKTITFQRKQYDYLSDMEWVKAVSGWRTVQRDKTVEEKPITLTQADGSPKVYEKGLGANAVSEIIYDLSGKGYERFEADVGVDRAKYSNKQASIVFIVYADGEEVYNSGVMKGNTPLKHVSLDVWNVSELKLVISDAGDGIGNDNGDWADAKLIMSDKIVNPPVLSSEAYQTDEKQRILYRIPYGTDAQAAASQISCSDEDVQVVICDADGQPVDPQTMVATGFTAQMHYKDTPIGSYELSVLGDVGTGRPNVLSLLIIKSQILGKESLASAQLYSADLTGDGAVNIFDLVTLKLQILKGLYD